MPNPVILPTGFTLGKSFEYGIDVNLGTFASPVWQPCRRISGFSVTPTPITADAATYDDLGSPNSDVTGWSFAGAFTIQVNRSVTTGLYLPEVEAIIARTKPTATGEAAVLDVRWYHKPATGEPNPDDAGRGLATVATGRVNTGPGGEIEAMAVTLTGKGAYEEIPNPWTGWDDTAIPKITSITTADGSIPNDGELLTITGSGFLDVTAVTIGTSAQFTVLSGSTIVAVTPIGDAGTVNSSVTGPAGTSAVVPVVRGA